MNKRTLLIRGGAILALLVVSVFLFLVGKSHSVLVDNKAVDDLPALSLVEVEVNKLGSLELTPRDRDKFDVTGQRHSLTVTYTDQMWEEHVIRRTIKIPLMQDMVMVLLPVLVANPDADQSLWLELYEPPTYAVTMAEEEEVITDDLAGLVTDLDM
jgi:hypothetical protein